jgi:hypothetical protein
MSFIDMERNFAFVHVSKTSSVIEWCWRDKCGVKTEFGESRLFRKNLWIGGAHDSADFMSSEVPYYWNLSFRVGFVRNPWAWWLSAYYWYNEPRHSGFDFEKRFPTFREFILRWQDWRYKFPWGGYNELLCDRNQRILVDYVGHSERLQQDFDLICEKTGFPKTVLAAKPERRHYRDYYDAETKRVVAEHLSPLDIEIFGLTFEDGGYC